MFLFRTFQLLLLIMKYIPAKLPASKIIFKLLNPFQTLYYTSSIKDFKDLFTVVKRIKAIDNSDIYRRVLLMPWDHHVFSMSRDAYHSIGIWKAFPLLVSIMTILII